MSSNIILGKYDRYISNTKIRKMLAHHNDNYVILGNIVIQKKKR